MIQTSQTYFIINATNQAAFKERSGFLPGGEAHMSRPAACLHDQHRHDAVDGEKLMLLVVCCTSSVVFLESNPSHWQIGVTFAIVFGVILYRISTKAALHMSSSPITRNHVQLTVKTTAAIINLVVILILDEVYGAVARWLTVLGTFQKLNIDSDNNLTFLFLNFCKHCSTKVV